MALAGKRALVTGSTSGIGAGIAEELARAGADVVLHGLGHADEIEAFRSRLVTSYGISASFAAGDLSSEAGVNEMMAAAGQIDILVNNAGIQFVAPVSNRALAAVGHEGMSNDCIAVHLQVAEMPTERWNSVIAINLTAPFIASRAALPAMYSKSVRPSACARASAVCTRSTLRLLAARS